MDFPSNYFTVKILYIRNFQNFDVVYVSHEQNGTYGKWHYSTPTDTLTPSQSQSIQLNPHLIRNFWVNRHTIIINICIVRSCFLPLTHSCHACLTHSESILSNKCRSFFWILRDIKHDVAFIFIGVFWFFFSYKTHQNYELKYKINRFRSWTCHDGERASGHGNETWQ